MYARAFKGIASIGGAEAVGRLLTFAFTAMLAREAGLETLGYLSLSLALIALATIVSDGGLNQDATRRIVEGELPDNVAAVTIRVQLVAVLILAPLIALIGYAIYGLPTAKYVVVLLPLPLSMALAVPYLLDSRRRFAALAICRIVLTATTAAAGLVLLAVGVRGHALALAYVCGYWAASVSMWLFARAPARLVLAQVSQGDIRPRLRTMSRLGLASILLHVFVSLPIAIAGLISVHTLETVGVVTRLWFLLSAPAAMAGAVLIPLLAGERDLAKFKGIAAVAFFLGLTVSLLVSVFSEDLLQLLFGYEAGQAAPTLAVFVWALPLIGLVAVASAYLIAHRLDGWIAASYGLAIAIFLFTTFVLGGPVPKALDLARAWVSAYMILALVLVLRSLGTKNSKGWSDDSQAGGTTHAVQREG
ncbi:hypothetical protein [Nocardioides mesophilus]|uniref:Oligosaccharide flippase family protein n=1 Tax=Nocardioides mesophilus TaxID=433659 RepID=A0A7G9REF5_9ACTN|nr:hypothetical protein [Nocardioides mesophilus]QNN53980.1 hypothetical protein H9L09_06255 [Nocardioides mesophilus]